MIIQFDDIVSLCERAKVSIQTGELRWRSAADDMALAAALGASQRDIAERVGKSLGWVNGLLQWRAQGFVGTPFKSERSQPKIKPFSGTEHQERRRVRLEDLDPTAQVEFLRLERSKAEAVRAQAEAQRARADAASERARAERAKAEARAAKAKAESDLFEFFSKSFQGAGVAGVGEADRRRLVKCLGLLGSEHLGERDNAARMIEAQRKCLGLSWDDLIIPATSERESATDYDAEETAH